jgi:hypothetical protein
MTHQRLDEAVDHLRQEFDALPGLHLTCWQARRLLNLPDTVCDAALDRLVATGYLVQARDGGFRRRAPARLASLSVLPARATA